MKIEIYHQSLSNFKVKYPIIIPIAIKASAIPKVTFQAKQTTIDIIIKNNIFIKDFVGLFFTV